MDEAAPEDGVTEDADESAKEKKKSKKDKSKKEKKEKKAKKEKDEKVGKEEAKEEQEEKEVKDIVEEQVQEVVEGVEEEEHGIEQEQVQEVVGEVEEEEHRIEEVAEAELVVDDIPHSDGLEASEARGSLASLPSGLQVDTPGEGEVVEGRKEKKGKKEKKEGKKEKKEKKGKKREKDDEMPELSMEQMEPREVEGNGDEDPLMQEALAPEAVGSIGLSEEVEQKRFSLSGKEKVAQLLTPTEREFLKHAFKRYDVDGSGRLDGKELRMAVRELGWDTKQETLDKWARLGGLEGLALADFEMLIASGKLGLKTFKPARRTAGQAVEAERQWKQMTAAGAQLQTSSKGRQGRRMGLVPGQEEPALEDLEDLQRSPGAMLGEGESVFAELPAHRKIELMEAWSFWDADHSGFLEPLELLSATKGLGFHFPIELIVSVCGKHGGGVDQEAFVRIMSVQIKQRDQELGIWDAQKGLDLDSEPETTLKEKWRKELAKAQLNLRRTSVTDSVFRWRSLVCTSHATVGEYAIGVRLYFDLLMLLVIAFGVLTFMTIPLLMLCAAGTGGPVLQQTDEIMSGFARYSVGNLDRTSAADATVHIMNEFIGSMSLLGVLLLFRFVIMKRATYTTSSMNLANLAVQVRALPRDLGYHHMGYEELLREHFQTVAYERAVRMGTVNDLDDQPVREVVMWRSYEGAVHGVLKQVELQARQRSINTELKFLEQKASEYHLSDQLEHDLGYTAGGSLAPTAGQRQSTKGRLTMQILKERQSSAMTASSSIHEVGADYSAAVTAMAERMYDRICSRSDGGKRLAKRQSQLLAQNDLIEEQILQIETDRALHSDLKPQEREVLGAFVVFWCERTRDAVMGQYGWSRSWCCRACCQPRRLRFKLPFEESSDNSEGAPDDEEVAFPLIVEPTQDPSLQLWQNMDVKPFARLARGCVMAVCRFLVLLVVFGVACFTGSTHVYYPILLPMEAKVWVVTNMSEPVVDRLDDPGCWRLCELELFSDELCQERLDPYMWVSSNGLPMSEDAGLRFVGDRNFAGGSVCMNDWRPAECWAPLNLSSLCHAGGLCPAAERRAEAGPRRAASEAERQLSVDSDCAWLADGSYDKSRVTFTIRFQSLLGAAQGTKNTKTELGVALTKALLAIDPTLEAPVNTSDELRKPYVFWVSPVPPLPAQDQGSGCGDAPEAASKLASFLGLSGPDLEALTSCQDFARMGLLGVPFCSNLPRVLKCLCGFTCGCNCNATCACEDPLAGALLPLNRSGSIFTWEAEISFCSSLAPQLLVMTCAYVNIFDTKQLDATAADTAKTLLDTLRGQDILPISISAGPPMKDQSCDSGRPCGMGEVQCYSRFNQPVCARRCDGFEDCADATDELGCRPCGGAECELPVGRCVDDASAGPCVECSDANLTELTEQQQEQCELMQITAGQGASAGLQCKASLCDALGDGCDPTLPSFDPCGCLEARGAGSREALGCLVRGNFSAALRGHVNITALHHFDAVKAKKLEDELEKLTMACTNAEGSSGGCETSGENQPQGVEGPALILTGEDWLEAEEEVATPSAQSWHLWVKTTCTSCCIAGLFGGGSLLVDEDGRLASRPPGGSYWQPKICGGMNDGTFHFVGISVGPAGELLVQDGFLCGQRSWQEAGAAGWSSASASSLAMYGKSADTSLGIYSGEMDAAAIFLAELTLADMRHHMLAASWRGSGPTFLQRYLAAACEDARLANSTLRPCGPEAEELLAATWPCVQGDLCGCSAKLRGRVELRCAVGCGTLRRSLLKILEERCSDELELARSCQTDSDCDVLFPPIGQEAKLACNPETYKCELGTTFVLAQHVLEGSICVARGKSSMPLHRWQAQYLLAALSGQKNASMFLTVEVAEGCQLPDFNASADFVTAHDGSTAFERTAADFGTTSTTEASTTENATEADTTSMAPATTRAPGLEGKLEVLVDGPSVIVFGSGGVQQLHFKVNATADAAGLEALLTTAKQFYSVPYYISEEPPETLGPSDMQAGQAEPNLPRDVVTDGDRVLNVSYVTMGTPLVSVTYQEPELCSSAEFECEPGVCVLCPGESCLCDGWQDCENGGDEDIFGLMVLRNVTTSACELLRNRSLTNTSVNENGTVDGGDPCFGVGGFPCNGSTCVPLPRRCDGVEDCPDGADEEGCPLMPETRSENQSNSSSLWVAAVFFDAQAVRCAQLLQPDGVVVPEVRLLSCELQAVLPGTLDLARAAGGYVASPMRNPPANCRYMTSIHTATERLAQDAPPFLTSDVDHVRGRAVFAESACAVGPGLRDYEIIGLATAELAYESDQASTVVMCYCIQRMYLEPAVMLELPADDKRFLMCQSFVEMSQGNYHRSWIRVAVIVIFNELFEAVIRGTSTSVCYKDESTQLVRHFKNLYWFWLFNGALMPALVSCTVPAFWGWLNRALELGTVQHGGISMREWHGWVGSVISITMLFRTLIPQLPDLLAVLWRVCRRRLRARKTISQEDLRELYVNPQFRIAEGFAEVTVTASIAMIFGPALPLLNVLAATSCLTRYLVDWFIFLRHSQRPPMYDELIARTAVNHLLVALVFRSATSILVWVDPTLFASDVAGCSVDESDASALRAQYFQENFRMFELFVNPTCNPGAWFFGFLPGLSAVGCLIILPNLTIVRSILMVMCRRCRSKTGYLYDEVVKARLSRRMVASFQPRVHPHFQSAFKLLDLTANFNEQGLTDSSESRASTDLASEPEPEEEDLAVTIFGKEYEDMEYFKRLKKEKKREKKERKQKKEKHESTDPFEDDEVNPYDLGAQEKHKKKKKEKKEKRKGENYSEAQALSTLVDF